MWPGKTFSKLVSLKVAFRCTWYLMRTLASAQPRGGDDGHLIFALMPWGPGEIRRSWGSGQTPYGRLPGWVSPGPQVAMKLSTHGVSIATAFVPLKSNGATPFSRSAMPPRRWPERFATSIRAGG